MKLVKGKISFIRSILACIIFPLVFGYFYSYVMSGSNWSEVNQTIGIILIALLSIRAYFEYKIAKNKGNVKITIIALVAFSLYTIIRFFR
ncbi:hypothetical protein [Clostridium sp.]|uniref:hypothetical protein n=1 Tax=Clostridium sp. TaxID=1506 RepID=UPI0039956B90